jgi:hypothetical protein
MKESTSSAICVVALSKLPMAITSLKENKDLSYGAALAQKSATILSRQQTVQSVAKASNPRHIGS